MNIWKKYRKKFYGQCAILLYHRIAQLNSDPQMLAVSEMNFSSHLDFLKKNYNLLSIDDFFRMLESGKDFPNESVLLTFDDGYADNYSNALPILKQHNAQALFYICTGNLNTPDEFWWDELERLLLLPEHLGSSLSLIVKGNKLNYTFNTREERVFAYSNLLPLIRTLKPTDRRTIIEEINRWAGGIPPRTSYRSMTYEELHQMSGSPHAIIGAHTHSHASLAALSDDDQFEEIKKSKDILEEVTGKKIFHFSYPFGTKKDYSKTTINHCKEIGFKWVAANFPETADKRSNIFQLPRFLVRDWDNETFANNMNTFFR